MIRYENHMGVVDISHEYFSALVGRAVTRCFGVVGMAHRNATEGLISMLRQQDQEDKGVRVRLQDGHLVIDLHILVTYGVNIAAVVSSIAHKISYTVEDATGIGVAAVNIYVDGMSAV